MNIKRILLGLGAVLPVFFACGPEERTADESGYFVVNEPEEPASPYAGNVVVGISTDMQYEVSIPDEDDWLTLASRDSDGVTFALETNMEDSMRESLVSFVSGGTVVGEVGIIQKAGQGITFEYVHPGKLSAEGGSLDIPIVSNVDFELGDVPDAAWLTASLSSQVLHLEFAANPDETARRAVLEFFRKGKNSKVGVLSLEQEGVVYAVKLNGQVMSSLGDALAQLPSMQEAAVIELGHETFDEHVAIGKDVKVPVTISGTDGTVISSVEIMKGQVTLSGVTLRPSGSFEPVLDPSVASGYRHPFGLFVHRAGFGVSIEDVTVDMTAAAEGSTGMFWVGDPSERGSMRDLLTRSSVKSRSGERNVQIYGAVLDMIDNSFESGHNAYSVRIGGTANDILIHNNRFSSASGSSTFGVQFYSMANSSITFGDGEGDTNSQDGSFASIFGSNEDPTPSARGNSFNPRISYNAGVITLATKGLTRVWGKYTADQKWDAPVSSVAEWDRNAAMSEDYIYVPICGRVTADWGVAVFMRESGEFYHKVTAGIDSQAGLFPTCGATSIKDGASTIVLVCNMVNAAGGHLKVYAYRNPDTAPETIIDYTLTEALRYGDKISAAGDWDSGYIIFTPYGDPSDHKRKMLMFPVNGGVVSKDPLVKNLNVDAPSATGNENHMNGFYLYNTIEALYAGTQRPSIYNRWEANDANSFDQTGDSQWQMVYQRKKFENSMLDPRFFKIGEQEYMAYASYVATERYTSDGKPIATGYLRVVSLPADYDASGYSHLKVKMYKIMDDDNLSSVSEVYALGDAVNSKAGGTIATNGTGYCSVLQLDGKTYLLAGITGAGMSLFRFND